jgi:outer membrane murein-binding lipoprotein Lpp
VEDLSSRLSDQAIAGSMTPGGGGGGASEAEIRELARGVNQLVSQMRAEQKVVREWVDEQAAQQSEVASALRELANNMHRRG